jgi:hypothetical protein
MGVIVISTVAKSVTAAVAIAAALGATTVQAASAKSGDGVRVAGTCSDTSSSKLKVKHDDRRLAVEFEVDQNRNGVRWRVVLRHNGVVAVRTRATTHAPSGSFSVERRLADGAGSDRITARATSPSGEVCTAGLSI